ncbi:hypothetical protein M422DRAFT_198385 [Sphaerobolus stellatus SS14]|nr:hypothetical protein M422DRAFT_198385 [Sphaerobolus stellatus SS14]
MGYLAREISDVAQVFKRAAPEQGGIITGANPVVWNMNDPFPLWVIQVFIIICFTQLLAIGLARFRQPRVIAEIIGGIILGPTVMGRIPSFSNNIFPQQSIPLLTLTSTVGLVLFLFLIGMEVDIRVLKRNAKYSLSISAAGIVLPFGLGVLLAIALFKQFSEEGVQFGHFLLFVGVAVSITAFPVLCRILTDLNLLDDHVGVIVLSAGVGNDVVGWVLLALAVALTNAGSGLAALWILLTGVAFCLFMFWPVRMALVWLAKRTGSLQSGSPTPLMMTTVLLLILVSAFFTDVIGIHPIFGGFIAGLIIPHEGGFAIALVEKLEDLVCIVFLPLYFVLSGLRTNLGLLDNGATWGYVFLICAIAFFGKFIGCALSAKVMGFSNRESTAIGTLMSCKGLVELIVLNVGLQAGILSTRLFSMFVVHALFLTILTTPLTLWCYPAKYRTGRLGKAARKTPTPSPEDILHSDDDFKTRFTLVMSKLEHLPAVMTIAQLLQPIACAQPALLRTRSSVTSDLKGEGSHDNTEGSIMQAITAPPPALLPRSIAIDALRLMELTDRTSAVMRSSEADELVHRDPLISVFSSFGRLLNISVRSSISVAPHDTLSTSVASHAKDADSQMVVIPWSVGSPHMSEEPVHTPESTHSVSKPNPFEGLFRKGSYHDNTAAQAYASFVRNVFSDSPTDTALFVDCGAATTGNHHIFFPFFGGPDDRLALKFVVQLCASQNVTATVVRVRRSVGDQSQLTESVGPTEHEHEKENEKGPIEGITVNELPVRNRDIRRTQSRVASDTADNLLWTSYSNQTDQVATGNKPIGRVPPHVQAALWRVTFGEISSPLPLRSVIQRGFAEANRIDQESLLIVTGRSKKASESHRAELDSIIAEQNHPSIDDEVTKTVGKVAAAFMAAAIKASGILVLQAAPEQL